MRCALLLPVLLCGCATTNPGLIEQVNQSVNQSMRYQSDGVDTWNANCPSSGDCEDFALCKARKLIAGGMSANDLNLMICDRNGRTHAVLMADGIILDSLQEKYCLPIYTCNLGTGNISIGKKVIGKAEKCQQAASELN